MGLGEGEALGSIREGLAGDTAAAAAGDGEGVDVRPCRVEALAEGEEGEMY